MEIKQLKISELKAYSRNPKAHPDKQIEKIANSIKEFGFNVPILVDKNNEIIAGHGRYLASQKLGLTEVPVIKIESLTPEQVKAYRIADNRLTESGWEYDFLQQEIADLKESGFDVTLTGFDLRELGKFEFDANPEAVRKSLSEDYIIPPFSVLNAREGVWQDRKKYWNGFIAQPDKTREGVLKFSKTVSFTKKFVGGTSQFDPVLAEILYYWFCPKGGDIFDFFAGDVEQQLVAGKLGYKFTGIELRQEQINANLEVAKKNKYLERIKLFCDDSEQMDKHIKSESMDFIISCPPYYDLETYSGGECDMSSMETKAFDEKYARIIKKSFDKLKQNRFIAIIVGEVRNKDKNGFYRGLVPKTIKYCEEAGYQYYNELILVTAIGSLPLRVRKFWEASRKVGKTHQNILIFYKGEDINLTFLK